MATTINTEPNQPTGERLREYFRTLTFEWKKISYPDKKTLIQSTTVVFVFVLIFCAIISVYDFVVGWFFHKLILPPA